MKAWEICGHTIQPGEKKQIMLKPYASSLEMPATFICGKQDGKTILITAGVHGDEYPGIAAVIETADELDPQKVHGRILLIHCVNISGFWARSRNVTEDNINLNAIYPGDPFGTPGQRIAAFFVSELFGQVDFIIDLHSGSAMEPLTPCVFFPAAADDAVFEASLAAARATDIPYLIASDTATGHYSYAASQGTPGLVLERGHSGYCSDACVAAYWRDIYLLLRHFGCYQYGEVFDVCPKTVYRQAIYLTADQKGLWRPAVTENMKIRKGAPLGYLHDFWGNVLQEYFAEEDGLVFYYNFSLAVNTGDDLIAYGLDRFAEQ